MKHATDNSTESSGVATEIVFGRGEGQLKLGTFLLSPYKLVLHL